MALSASRMWRREYIGQFGNSAKSKMKSKRHVSGAPGTGNGKHFAALGDDCKCGRCSTK